MSEVTTVKHAITVILIACVIVITAFAADVLKTGMREISPLENIHGQPYTFATGAQHIAESLAHADIYLKEPVAGKELTIVTTFIPKNTQTLSLGVREDSFWLSYNPIPIYTASPNNHNLEEPLTVAATIPLTDKLQASDRSLDVMYFADTNPTELLSGNVPVLERPIQDQTEWELLSVSTSVQIAKAPISAWKDYVKSILKQERPL